MRTGFIKKELEKASKYLNKSNTACSEIANELQPYFKYEISVFHQAGDGFIVCWEGDDIRCPPYNIPVTEVLEDLKIDKKMYL